MIFVDSNIPMYLVGGDHPHKTDARIQLERCLAAGERLVTDAEVLQEILHRFTAIHRPEAIGPTLRLLLAAVDQIFPVTAADALRAAEIIGPGGAFGARDAVHIAVMERRGVGTVLSFDADYDRRPGLQRIGAVT